MMVTVQLDANLQDKLLAEARAQGVSLEAYLAGVIQRAAASEGKPPISLTEFEAGLRELADGSEQLPVLAPDAYRRDSIYGDS
jgi:hypothetical protein